MTEPMIHIEVVPFREFNRFDPKDETFSTHCQFLPLVHQIVSNPRANHRFPAIPLRDDYDSFDGAIRYWDACYYFLRVILGWSDPAAGLYWYLERGRTDDSNVLLHVLRSLWDYNGQLDYLAAWLFRHFDSHLRDQQLRFVFDGNMPPPKVLPTDKWLNEFLARHPSDPSQQPPNPYYGGSNPLHLGHFSFVYEDYRESAPLLFTSDKQTRRACLVLDNAHGWYSALHKLCKTLEPLGDRSWHVDVFAKTIGYLGMFRQSRETGLWFHGKHGLHSIGNTHRLPSN